MKKSIRSISLMLLVCMLMSFLPAQAISTNVAAINETEYATLEAALSAAKAGDTVKLLNNTVAQVVSVNPKITLDLNGKTLEAEYVIALKGASVVDSHTDNTGKLKIAQDCVALDCTNSGYLPVYDANGYIFTTVKLEGRSKFVHTSKFVFSPLFESFAHEALSAGESASGARVVIRLSWISEQEGNFAAQQEFVYLDKMVKDVISSFSGDYALAFAATFTDVIADLGKNVQVTAAVKSATGVEIVGTAANAPTTPGKEEQELEELLASKADLRFNANGEFKTMVFADMHVPKSGLNAEQQGYIKTVIDREQPNLVIFTGDNMRGSGTDLYESEADHRAALDTMVGYLEEKGIYWMHVFGNHDHELTPVDKEGQMDIYSSYEYCLSKDPVKELTGVGNYVVPVYSSDENSKDIKFAVWGLDSGNYLSAEDQAALFPDGQTAFGGYDSTLYDYIHSDQIDWYEETSKKLEDYVGNKVYGMMAFHIPLQETYSGWINRNNLPHGGVKNENVCASAYNSGLFEAMRTRGDIKATVSGHDHTNSFWVEVGGIKLSYSPTISTCSYHDKNELGSRVFVVNENDPSNVETYISYVSGRVDVSGSDCKEIKSGTTFDFEGESPNIIASGNHSSTTDDIHTIKATVENNVGKDGSKALAISRQELGDTQLKRNSQVIFDVPYGKLGDNKYLAVWVDFETNNVDLRKACFGLVKNYDYSGHYETDANDTITEYYMKADGADSWTTMKTGTDGCFGNAVANDKSKGFKGWMAFPIENMHHLTTDETLQPGDVITSILVFTSINDDAGQVGKDAYFDNFMLVSDYRGIGEKPFPSATPYDFETPTEFSVGYPGYSAEINSHDTIYAQIVENKGINQSKALAVCRTEWNSDARKQNAGVNWYLDEKGVLGENKYLMVWMDFETNNIDFRKASWGVFAADTATRYCTDDFGAGAQFHYLADGSDTWTTYTMGSDGCFGKGGSASVKGFKGWFAFPTNTFKSGSNTLNSGSVITGYFLYFSPLEETDAGKPVYIDNVMLVEDYKTAL